MKGKSPTTACAKTLVTLQLSARGLGAVRVGWEKSIIEDLSIIKAILEYNLCICAL